MADLAEFLLARIAEDEAAASNNGTLTGDRWTALQPEPGHVSCDVVGAGRGVVVNALQWEAQHIARHDPARVLAECEAKRRIVETWQSVQHLGTNGFGPNTLRLLALPYADHPEYLPEWRP